jgi:hypothetical protein
VGTGFLTVKQNGCVVKKDVNSTEALRGSFDHCPHIVFIRHVALCEKSSAFRTLNRFNCGLATTPVDLGYHHSCAFLGKAQGHSLANAATSPSDNSHFALQSHS